MGVRLCFASPLLPRYKRLSNGMFKFSGLGNEGVDGGMKFFYPLNLTQVIFTTDPIECIHSIDKNLSDLGAAYLSQHETLNTHSQVPVPIISRKMFIVSGHLVGQSQSQQITAMTNFSIFDPLSYIICCLLFASLILILLINYCMLLRLKRKKRRFLIFLYLIVRKYNKMSKKMPSVRLMITLLSFMMMLHFEILYKTEQVVREKPEVIDSYKKLLSKPDVLPVFFDGLFPDSDEFKFAPVDSLRGKIWQRLVSKVPNYSQFVIKGIHFQDSSLERHLNLAKEIIQQKFAVISSYQTSLMVAGAVCSCSEFDFWKTVVNADQSENEELAGWAVRGSFEYFNKVRTYLRHVAESATLIHFLDSLDTGIGYNFIIATSDHISKQKKLCLGHEKAYSDTNDDLVDHSLSINYYLSFGELVTSLFVLSTVIWFIERLFQLTGKLITTCRKVNGHKMDTRGAKGIHQLKGDWVRSKAQMKRTKFVKRPDKHRQLIFPQSQVRSKLTSLAVD